MSKKPWSEFFLVIQRTKRGRRQRGKNARKTTCEFCSQPINGPHRIYQYKCKSCTSGKMRDGEKCPLCNGLGRLNCDHSRYEVLN